MIFVFLFVAIILSLALVRLVSAAVLLLMKLILELPSSGSGPLTLKLVASPSRLRAVQYVWWYNVDRLDIYDSLIVPSPE